VLVASLSRCAVQVGGVGIPFVSCNSAGGPIKRVPSDLVRQIVLYAHLILGQIQFFGHMTNSAIASILLPVLAYETESTKA